MTTLFADLVQRLIKEIKITLAGSRESVLAISERINRKTETLRLHWQAAAMTRQMDNVYRSVGQVLCNVSAPADYTLHIPKRTHTDVEAHILEAAATVRLLKKELAQVEGAIRELELEGLHEDFIKIQRDLSVRGAGLSRILVASGSSVIGLSPVQLDLPPAIRIAALLRGPALISPTADTIIRAGDIVILLGPMVQLQHVASQFMARHRAAVLRTGGEI